MKKGNYFFTSESVTEGHPDKVCDQISDAFLDECLRQDRESRVAVEAMTTTGLVVVAGEVTTKGDIDTQKIVRDVLQDIGYDRSEYGFCFSDVGVVSAIHEQSPDISQGVTAGQGEYQEQGAGDQGLMFGYATNETKELMPLPIMLAHKLTKRLAEIRKNKEVGYLRPDGKSQVTVEYEDGQPKRVEAVVLAAHHDENVALDDLRRDLKAKVILPIVGDYVDENTKYFINATGRFVLGGPPADTGLTGRKIIVDTYGGHGSHGGGCFSGKDPSKVDRSASYAARYIAKNIVAAKLADKCEVQIAYSIGVAEPVSLLIDTFGTGKIDEWQLAQMVRDKFPLKPADIIDVLDLKQPKYLLTAAYGHFGRSEDGFTWEKVGVL
ncbi:MAG: methionine adenosyltransferase [Patescibacteria group bacterium]